MAIAFVFPGQGSQAVGMGAELAKAHASARAVFDEVDARARPEALPASCSMGPLEALTLTENAQPALMAVSLAVMRVLEEKGLSPRRQGEICRRPFARRVFRACRSRRHQRRRCRSPLEDARTRHAGGRAGRARRHGGAVGRRQGGGREARRRGRARRSVPARQRQRADPGRHLRRQDAPSTEQPSSPRRTACAASCRSTSARPSIAR